MCGLVGYWDTSNESSADALTNRVSAMAEVLTHRGPDSQNTWVDDRVGIALGHRRLAILDVSDAGLQPMKSASARYVIAFNGEIYNHLDLRQDLEAQSAAPTWRGTSDTETLLACIDAWGFETCLDRITGMFAIVVFDTIDCALYLARDRFGEKPLYYGVKNGVLVFGSELKILRPAGWGRIDIDPVAVAHFFDKAYVPSPHCMVEGMHKLTPGHWMRITANDLTQGRMTSRVYWNPVSAARCALSQRKLSIGEFEGVLTRAVERQLISDVPLGAFLSGGIDSSTIVALMQSVSQTPVKTYTIAFDLEGFNEAPFAREIANHLRTEHHEHTCTMQDAMNLVPKLSQIYCEPFADSSQIPTLLVSQLASRDVRVALTGDGGDELLAGYRRYRHVAKLHARLKQAPDRFWSVLGAVMSLVPGLSPHLRGRAAVLRQMANGFEAFYGAKQSYSLEVGGSSEPHPRVGDHDLSGLSPVEKMMLIDTLSYLTDDILVKVDRAAMYYSLETRVPLLDHSVFSAVWQMQDNRQLHGKQPKAVLHEILARYVPRPLFERPKMGFKVPISEWMNRDLRDWVESRLAHPIIADGSYVDSRRVQDLWKSHQSGDLRGSTMLWSIIMLADWYDQFVAGAPAA